MTAPELYWLPDLPNWDSALKSLNAGDAAQAWENMVALANSRVDFLRTQRLARALERHLPEGPPALATRPVRLAILSSSTVDHLLAGLRVGALRRGLWMTAYRNDYGQFFHELVDTKSGLHRFSPNVILFALDAHYLLGAADAGMNQAAAEALVESACANLQNLWRLARAHFAAQVIQQCALPVFPALFGSNEHRLPGSRRRLLERLNMRLRELADAEGVDLMAIDTLAMKDGLAAWHDPVLWHRAKQEVHPAASHVYGDLVARLVAAQQGRSAKCLVLDLDNTLWGGVIGDDGVDGIVLGQGSALGEAYIEFQRYAREQMRRGTILAVSSKNDEANALAPFRSHPEMVLAREDFSCFVANWHDKASHIRQIAGKLNIGLDAMVFVDDNPFERNIVRRELPMVSVPELPDDPALYARCLADAGYFEGLALSAEDLERTQLYRSDLKREEAKSATTDLDAYLKSLCMTLHWKPFDKIGLTRIVQLINKTNQFNLTTQRYTEGEVRFVMEDPLVLTLQLQLVDSFGNNGIIGVIIGRLASAELKIDTWLMSCRVIGRQVEQATMNLIAECARRRGAERVIGEYRPTPKNGMVREHYPSLGFSPLPGGVGGNRLWSLDLASFKPFETHIALTEDRT